MHKQLSKNFHSSEFDCPSKPYTGVNMNPLLIDKLQMLRNIIDKSIIVTSGFRTKEYNKEVGGAKDSSHTHGNAVDIAITNSLDRFFIVKYALVIGIERIGIYKTHIHLDISTLKESPVIWYK